MFSYSVHGLNILSDIDLHTPQIASNASIDITIHHHAERIPHKKIDSKHNLFNTNQELQALLGKTQGGELLVDFLKSGFFCKKGRELHITRECDDEDFFRAIVATQILPLVSSLYRITLHGGVVTYGDQAVIYLAPEGYGKSTLTAFLQKNQHTILSDDVAALDISPQGIHVFPGLPEIRLNKDSCQTIFNTLAHPQKLAKLKISTPPTPLKKYQLRAIFILTPQTKESTDFHKKALNPAQAFASFLQHQFHWDIWQPQALNEEFSQLTQLAQKIPTFELNYPFHFQSLPWISQQLLESLADDRKNLPLI